HVGVGARFGDRRQFDLGYRFQHLSNGGIKKPNQGINFNQIRFAYHF
ncbi:MAG: acyloxyacyl hydrolase, partial [Gallionella sp.]|nr:acyloxyacyl hydrolase [Gallionella sp.]